MFRQVIGIAMGSDPATFLQIIFFIIIDSKWKKTDIIRVVLKIIFIQII